MAPRIFEKFFKREKKRNDRDRPSESWPTAIGISDPTCEIKGDRFHGWKLPIPAPGERSLLSCKQTRADQYASGFFGLPPEVRRRIYIVLMGNRRVHIEYAWMLQSPFEPPTKRGGKRWDWWHGVCQENDSFVQDTYLESCPDRGDERWNARQKGVSVRPTPGTKLEGVEWLRCCQIGYVVLVGLGFAIQFIVLTPLKSGTKKRCKFFMEQMFSSHEKGSILHSSCQKCCHPFAYNLLSPWILQLDFTLGLVVANTYRPGKQFTLLSSGFLRINFSPCSRFD